jgi:hypothetical protein
MRRAISLEAYFGMFVGDELIYVKATCLRLLHPRNMSLCRTINLGGY